MDELSNQEIGRVLRASTGGFAVGCRVGQLSGPSFGCLVKAQPVDSREAVYGLMIRWCAAWFWPKTRANRSSRTSATIACYRLK
jgi:hypothetical protein